MECNIEFFAPHLLDHPKFRHLLRTTHHALWPLHPRNDIYQRNSITLLHVRALKGSQSLTADSRASRLSLSHFHCVAGCRPRNLSGKEQECTALPCWSHCTRARRTRRQSVAVGPKTNEGHGVWHQARWSRLGSCLRCSVIQLWRNMQSWNFEFGRGAALPYCRHWWSSGTKL